MQATTLGGVLLRHVAFPLGGAPSLLASMRREAPTTCEGSHVGCGGSPAAEGSPAGFGGAQQRKRQRLKQQISGGLVCVGGR